MKGESASYKSIPDRLIWIGIGLSVFFWIAESAIHAFVFREGNIFQQILRPELHEIWMRSLFVLVIIIFSFYAQFIINRSKQTEEVLQESESFLQSTFDAIQDGISVRDRDLTITRVNKWMKQMYASEMPLVGKKCYSAFQQRKSVCPWCPSIIAMETGVMQTQVVPYPSAEKPSGWIELTALLLKDIGGKVVGAVEHAKDITERKQSKEALCKREQELNIRNRISRVFLTIPDDEMYGEVLQVILEAMQSPYGTFAYINEDGDRIVPSMTRDVWDECKIPGKSIFFPRKEWGDTIWAGCIIEKRAISSNEPFKVPDGHIPVIRAMAVPIIHKGEAIGNFMVGNKETDYNQKDQKMLEIIASYTAPILNARLQRDRHEKERKQAEEALRDSEKFCSNLLNNSLHPILVINPDTSVKYVTPALETLTGFSSEEIIGRKAPYPWWTKETMRKTGEDLKVAMREGAKKIEELFQKKNGERFWVEITSAPIRENGEFKYYLANWVETTERKRTEEEKERMQVLLLQAQKMYSLGTLVSGVAHEINNPINTIMISTPLLQKIWRDFHSILKEHADKDPGRKYGGLTYDFLRENLDQLISDMDIAANHVAAIIKGLKDFSRKESVTDRKSIQINTAVKNAVRLVQTTLRKSGIDLELDLAQDLPLMQGNLQNLEQIILNLTINAVQAIDHGHGKVKIKTGFKKRDEQIFISVSDNGRGIDPALSNKVFDPFFTDKQAEGGTGLGLSVTHSLVKAHDGEITLQSEKGIGTTFTVFFPTILRKKPIKILKSI